MKVQVIEDEDDVKSALRRERWYFFKLRLVRRLKFCVVFVFACLIASMPFVWLIAIAYVALHFVSKYW